MKEQRRGRGRPATGIGTKLGLYLTKDRMAKLGANPTKAIYDLIDRSPAADAAADRFLHVSIRLTPTELVALGVNTEVSAKRVISKLLAQAVARRDE